MKISQINAYVSPTTYLEGKQEHIYPCFHEDLALLDPNCGYTAVAARGLTLKSNKATLIPASEIAFLEENLPRREMVAIRSDHGVLIVLGHLYSSCGLLPALLPHGCTDAAAYAVGCLGNCKILVSPAVSALASNHSEAETVYHNLTDLLYLCLQILEPPTDADFRLHCARIAQLAGCKANVTALPSGHFPISTGDFQRWTAFLLCVFLTLRGDSSVGTALHLDHANLREFFLKLSHQSEYSRKEPVSDTVYRFLELPAFSDFQLIRSGNCFSIEAKLQRCHPTNLLHAPLADLSPVILRIDLF